MLQRCALNYNSLWACATGQRHRHRHWDKEVMRKLSLTSMNEMWWLILISFDEPSSASCFADSRVELGVLVGMCRGSWSRWIRSGRCSSSWLCRSWCFSFQFTASSSWRSRTSIIFAALLEDDVLLMRGMTCPSLLTRTMFNPCLLAQNSVLSMIVLYLTMAVYMY